LNWSVHNFSQNTKIKMLHYNFCDFLFHVAGKACVLHGWYETYCMSRENVKR
jgi:hypothetical protein